MRTRITTLLVVAITSIALLGCSEDPEKRPRDGSGGAEGVGGDINVPAGPGLMGVVKDAVGVPVLGAKVEAGGQQAYSDAKGLYSLEKLTPGSVTVKVTQDWFQEKSESATVKDTGMTTLDVTIDEHPLKLDPADKTMADSYNKIFDWTTDTISIVVLPKPTRKELDNAIYFHNPALFRDTSNDTLTPTTPLPALSGGAKNFDFQAQNGKQVLESSSIKDTLGDTQVTATEQSDWMMWKPLLTYLKDWDAAKVKEINDAGIAVRQQTWGDSNAVHPQSIERVYMHNGELWVEVVFESFVKVGGGITDSDGDGRTEVFAKMTADHYSTDVINKIKNDYLGQAKLNTHGMSNEINHSLNELYTSTAAEVEKYIAQQYDLPKDTVQYPFVVLKHSGGQINVLLAGP